jgi:hypothetical protein
MTTGSSFSWTTKLADSNDPSTGDDNDITVQSKHRPAMYDTRGAWFDGINDYIELNGLEINGHDFAILLFFKAENNESTLFHVPVVLDRYNEQNADTENVELWIDRCNYLHFDVGVHRVSVPISQSTWTVAIAYW